MATSHETPGPSRGFAFALETVDGRLCLRARHRPEYGVICADWDTPEMRRRIAAGRKQLLARAVGLPRVPQARVLDATAGLGRDGFTLAALGAEVTMLERHPLIAALLQDARERALALPGLFAAAQRVQLRQADAAQVLQGEARWDAVYLDPMYPHAGKTALPQKEMQFFRELTDGDPDSATLLDLALARARRVVVKRPARAAWLADRKPSLELSGTQARFDVYLPPMAA